MKKQPRIKAGDRVLIQVEVVRQCGDQRPDEQKGWVVKTSRGEVMVNPDEIFFPLAPQ